MTAAGAPYRILSIDGGGVRGLVAALVLAELEARAGRPVAQLFDLVAGTSAGAILALGLLRPDAAGTGPRWQARELVDMYEVGGPRIFHRSHWRYARTANGFLGPKYDAAELETELRERLGDTHLSQSLRDVIVPTYDTHRREPYFFKHTPGRGGGGGDPLMRVVARASAAAPTYFPPVRVHDAEVGQRWLVDGGVGANNPALCAYAEVRRSRPEADVALVSVGCGQLSTDFATSRMRRAGALLWARPLFDVVLDGQEKVTDYQARQLLPSTRYWRLQADLRDSSERIDDSSPANLRALRDGAARLIQRSSGQIDDLAALLTGSAQPAER